MVILPLLEFQFVPSVKLAIIAQEVLKLFVVQILTLIEVHHLVQQLLQATIRMQIKNQLEHHVDLVAIQTPQLIMYAQPAQKDIIVLILLLASHVALLSIVQLELQRRLHALTG